MLTLSIGLISKVWDIICKNENASNFLSDAFLKQVIIKLAVKGSMYSSDTLFPINVDLSFSSSISPAFEKSFPEHMMNSHSSSKSITLSRVACNLLKSLN